MATELSYVQFAAQTEWRYMHFGAWKGTYKGKTVEGTEDLFDVYTVEHGGNVVAFGLLLKDSGNGWIAVTHDAKGNAGKVFRGMQATVVGADCVAEVWRLAGFADKEAA